MTIPLSEPVIQDGMCIEWDVGIEMDDGLVLRCDVFRPIPDGEYPVIISYGPYGKWLHFEDRNEDLFQKLLTDHPEIAARSSNRYQNWETPNPEVWVPDGYVIIRVDSRGTGRSPGYMDIWSDREAHDLKTCIEWAGDQPWSNGKVGLNGISYYAMNQWQVAALQPEYLAAICVWEGAADWYRDFAHHGGICCTFGRNWYEKWVVPIQHGRADDGYRSRMTGGWVSGPDKLTPEELGNNRADLDNDLLTNKLATDEYWTSRNPDWSKVNVPLFSSANWGTHGLHTRGNFEGFKKANTEQKWLEVHGREHWAEFYTDYGLNLQKKFFGHFLKGADTGWEDQPRFQLNVRHPNETFVERAENEWPLARTKWTRYYLHSETTTLSTQPQQDESSLTYEALDDGLTFLTNPLENPIEITGPMAAKLFVSSDTEDADLFLVFRVFDSSMDEIVFQGAGNPHEPVAFGWLRASHRKLDQKKSTEWRPFHPHDEIQPLTPGKIYELNVEIWPTSVFASAGNRLALSVRGRDYDHPTWAPFHHDHPHDRPTDMYGGDVTIHTSPDHPSHVLVPIIPDKE